MSEYVLTYTHLYSYIYAYVYNVYLRKDSFMKNFKNVIHNFIKERHKNAINRMNNKIEKQVTFHLWELLKSKLG